MSDISYQLEEERRRVDFDTFDISVKELVNMAVEGVIDIAPEYQRQFRWKTDNRSRFIESVFLGIPIPSLFTAANKDGTWELIDGVQRLSTLIHFVGGKEVLDKFGMGGPLKLEGLDILTDFNNKTFESLPKSLSLKFLLRPIKITTLSDKSDLNVRFDLFERLNTGGVVLTTQEIRACVYRGPLHDFICDLAQSDDFLNVLNLPPSKLKDGTPEELVLKFFAYFHNREKFQHSVVDFLNDFMSTNMSGFDYKYNRWLFEETFKQLREELPEGVKRGNRNTTPVNLFEAVTIGGAVAISEGKSIRGKRVSAWIDSDNLNRITAGGGTNTRNKLNSRIEFCADKFRNAI